MKESEKNQESISLPPPWCGAICRNAMNEVCIEHCAINRDCSGFEMKPGITIYDLPRLPEADELTAKEKFQILAVHLEVVVEHLKGETNEYYVTRRPNTHNTRSSPIPKDLTIQSVLHGIQETITPPEDREEHPSENVGSIEVVGTDD